MRAREHKAGIWKKAAKSNWDFKTGILEGEMAKQGLIDECLELSDSMRGDERQEKLRRRWKKLTGTRLVVKIYKSYPTVCPYVSTDQSVL